MARILLLKPVYLDRYMPAIEYPLGPMYLAAVLRQRTRHEVRIFDARFHDDWVGATRSFLEAWEPDVVGISAISVEHASMITLARLVKRWRPSVPVVVGGAHATAVPADCLREPSIDAVCVGEGEEVIVPLVEALLAHEDPSRVPGVYTDPDAASFPLAPPPDVDQLPLPAWELIDHEAYCRWRSMAAFSPWRYAAISTSRGCPFRCTYCHNVHGKTFRPRRPESVAEELAYLHRLLGHGAIDVLEDFFNLDPERAETILGLFAQTGGALRPSFPNGLRSDRIDERFIDAMVRSRTVFASFAIETACPRLQRETGKNLDLDRAEWAVRRAVERGLYINGFFMLGFPTETLAEMLETIRFACRLPLSQAYFFQVVPSPGSAIWDRFGATSEGYRAQIADTNYFASDFNLSEVPDWQFRWVFRLAYGAFYFRPTNVLRLAWKYPKKSALIGRGLDTLGIMLR